MSDGARSLDEIRALIVRGLRAEQCAIKRAIWDRIRDVVPAGDSSATREYEAGQLKAISAIVSYSLDAIARGPEWSEPIPALAAVQARRAARLGVSLGTVQRRYFAGHRELGEFVTQEVARARLSNDGAVIHHLRRTQEALLEHVIATIENEYEHERGLMTGSTCLEIVQQLLQGKSIERSELAKLDYSIETSHHVAITASGSDVQAIIQNAKARHPRRCLVADLDGHVHVWLAVESLNIEQLGVEHGQDVTLGVGEAQHGLDGWRLSHRQAHAAFQVAARKAERIVRYADDRLLAAAAENETLALSLTQRYLIPLRQSTAGAKLCRTVHTYMELEVQHNIYRPSTKSGSPYC